MFESALNFDDIDFDDNTPSVSFSGRNKSSIGPAGQSERLGSFKKPPAVSLKIPRNVVKRKFPGPAGLLPEQNESGLVSLELNSTSTSTEFPWCSQKSVSIFQEGAWAEMMGDFDRQRYLERYNIHWIKSKARLDQLPDQKAPFLAAIIQTIECFDGKLPVNVVLKDMTGEIQGSMIYSLYEEHADDLTVGSVIVLKQFGVLTLGQFSHYNHYLTITASNLVCIYSNQTKSGACTVKKIEVQSLQELPTIDQQSSDLDFADNFDIPEDFEENELRKLKGDNKNVPNSRKRCSSDKENDNLMEPNKCAPPPQKKFSFKGNAGSKMADRSKSSQDVTVMTCSQISVKTNSDHSDIWQNALEDVDAESLFGDF